jgi:hypothetical protein
LTTATGQAVASQLRRLPAHPEVADSVRRLDDAGLRLAALTNSTEQLATAHWSTPASSTPSNWSCRPTGRPAWWDVGVEAEDIVGVVAVS